MPDSQHPIKQRAIRFACSGILVTGFHAVIALLFLHYVAPIPALGNGVAFLVATGLSYWINTHWSFSSRLHGRTLIRFVVVSVLGLILTMTIARAAELGGLENWQGILVVVLTMPPLTFLLHNFWTYR